MILTCSFKFQTHILFRNYQRYLRDSKVSFPRKGIVIRKDGASTQEK